MGLSFSVDAGHPKLSCFFVLTISSRRRTFDVFRPLSLESSFPMPFYCHQVSYTTDARKRLLSDPNDRYEAVRAPIEKLGGILQSSFFTLGQFDVLVISEFPVDVSLAAIAVAFSQGGAIASILTIPLLPLPEARNLEADSGVPQAKSRPAARFAAAGR
jgi:uncharacterized protein with GYD domain